ncbi:hypothetical protein PMAYCL1PPCAC_05113, partial [Pristionchus mayeri]
DEVKAVKKRKGSLKKKKKVTDSPPPKASDVAGSKKIRVFKNGDIHHMGVKFVVNTRTTSNMQALLDAVNQRIELPYGAKKLYSMAGKAVKNIGDLENGKDYVAASNVFVPLPYGETQPGVIRWETPGSSFKATPTHSASTISRSRSTEPLKPINKEEKKKSIRSKSQAPNKLAAPSVETTKSDTDIPVAKKKKIVKKSSTSKLPVSTNGNGTPKKVVKKEENGEKKVEKKSEKPEKLNSIASPEKKKVLKKKVIKKKSDPDGEVKTEPPTIPAVEADSATGAAVAHDKQRPLTGTRIGKKVEIKENRESEASHAPHKPHSPAKSDHLRQTSRGTIEHTDGESDRDTDRSYNQSSPESSRPATRRMDKKKEEADDEDSDNASVESGESMPSKKKGK